MADIPFLDLKKVNGRQTPQIEAAVSRVLQRGTYVAGIEVESFEQEYARYCGIRHCVAVGNGYDALRLMLRAARFESGDELVLPANTHFATVLAVLA